MYYLRSYYYYHLQAVKEKDNPAIIIYTIMTFKDSQKLVPSLLYQIQDKLNSLKYYTKPFWIWNS